MGAITRFVKNSSLYFAVTVIQKLAMLGLFAYIARVFTKSEMGEYSLALVFIAVFGMLFCSYSQAGYQRFYFEYSGKERDEFEYSILNLLGLVSMLGILALYFFKATIKLYSFEMSDVLFLLLVVIASINGYTEMVFSKLRSENENRHYSALQLTKVGLYIALVLALFQFAKGDKLSLFFMQEEIYLIDLKLAYQEMGLEQLVVNIAFLQISQEGVESRSRIGLWAPGHGVRARGLHRWLGQAARG